jgi:hypothetical protein
VTFADAEDSELGAHLLSLEQRLLSPDVRRTPAALLAMLSPDFREFGSSGRIFTLDQIVAELGTEVPRQITLSDFRLTRASDKVALVTYRSHAQTAMQDGWRLHFHQGTRQQP